MCVCGEKIQFHPLAPGPALRHATPTFLAASLLGPCNHLISPPISLSTISGGTHKIKTLYATPNGIKKYKYTDESRATFIACNEQRAMCNVQYAMCNVQHATGWVFNQGVCGKRGRVAGATHHIYGTLVFSFFFLQFFRIFLFTCLGKMELFMQT